MEKRERCTLSNEQLIAAVNDIVVKICKDPGRGWKMTIPVDFNHDWDMLITELVDRFKGVLITAKRPVSTRRGILTQQVQEDLSLTDFAERHDLSEESQHELCKAVVNLLEMEIESFSEDLIKAGKVVS